VSEEPSPFRPGAVSYLRVPAPDPARLAGFYRDAFGWTIRGDPGEPAFTDGSGHVIGHFVPDLPVGKDAGVRPYIYVERIDESLGQVTAHGGEVTVPPYAEGDLWVALFRDPAGNIIGVWQQGPRL
jgi:predicted enzyme related to lactoylglutathione lyase